MMRWPRAAAMAAVLLLVVLAVPASAQTMHEHGASPSSESVTPPPPRALTLVVDPPRVELEPGGEALVRVVALTAEAGDVAFELSLPRDLAATEDAARTGHVDESGVAAVSYVVRALDSARPGEAGVGTVVVHEAAAWAAFEIQIVSPATPPPAEDAATQGDGARFMIVAGAAGAVALLLAFSLGTRLDRGALEGHPLRARMLALARAEPGITTREMQRRLGLSNGQLDHHLAKLEKARLLFVTPDGQRRRLFPAGLPRAPPVEDLASRVRNLIAQEGPMTPVEAAQRLGVSRQSLHYHVRRLTLRGLVVARAGRLMAATRDG